MPTPSPTTGFSPRTLWVASLVALLLQAILLWISYNPRPRGLVGDEVGYLEAAQSSGPSERDRAEPLRGPLYSRLLSALGVGPGTLLPIQILQMAMLLMAALLLRSLTRHLFGAPRAADLAALGMLLYPTLGAFSHYLWPEILHLSLWIAVLWILATGRRSPAWLLLAGSLLAAAILSRHLLLAFVPVVGAALWLDSTTQRGRRLAWLLAPLVLMLTPALWLDWSGDGRLRSASSVRFNLWVGLNDTSRKSFERSIVFEEYRAYLASADAPTERDEILEQKIRAFVDREGWPTILARQLGRQYFRLFDKDTFFTEQLPGGVLQGRRRGYGALGTPGTTLLRWLHYTLYGAMLALAAFGIASRRASDSRWLQLILLFLVYNLAIFLVLHVKSRYRLQLTPFLILFAAHGLDGLIAPGRELAPPRRWAALAGAVLALFLAFGGPFL